jgi:diacylglycerol kinase (ATP)
VVAIKGTLHMGGIQVNLTNAIRVAQGSNISITIPRGLTLPMQVDGEPWLQEPCLIHIKHHTQVRMLATTAALDELTLDRVISDISQPFM